jgi:uracil-DNA glycosylase family 4
MRGSNRKETLRLRSVKAPSPRRSFSQPNRNSSSAPLAIPEARTVEVIKAPAATPNRNPARRLKQLAEQIRGCPKCPLCQSRTLAVPGEGDSKAEFMIIGEAPGKDEDKSGHPFVGSAGRYLDHVLEGTGIQRSDFFITNIVKCRPPNNRTPKANEIDVCVSNYLIEQIELINPHLILLLGSVAVKTLLSKKSVEEVRGKVIELEGRKYLATYHPAARFYREDLKEKIAADFALLKRELKRFRKD